MQAQPHVHLHVLPMAQQKHPYPSCFRPSCRFFVAKTPKSTVRGRWSMQKRTHGGAEASSSRQNTRSQRMPRAETGTGSSRPAPNRRFCRFGRDFLTTCNRKSEKPSEARIRPRPHLPFYQVAFCRFDLYCEPARRQARQPDNDKQRLLPHHARAKLGLDSFLSTF